MFECQYCILLVHFTARLLSTDSKFEPLLFAKVTCDQAFFFSGERASMVARESVQVEEGEKRNSHALPRKKECLVTDYAKVAI